MNTAISSCMIIKIIIFMQSRTLMQLSMTERVNCDHSPRKGGSRYHSVSRLVLLGCILSHATAHNCPISVRVWWCVLAFDCTAVCVIMMFSRCPGMDSMLLAMQGRSQPLQGWFVVMVNVGKSPGTPCGKN